MTNLKSSQGIVRRSIYVGLSKPKDPKKIGSALIRFSEIPKSVLNPKTWFHVYKASHVFLAYPAHGWRPFYLVNEATGSGVRWVSEPFFADHTCIVELYLFELPIEHYRAVKNYGSMMSGAPYPWLENLGIGLQRLAKWFLRKDIINPFDNNARAIKCSELFFRAFFNHRTDLDFMKIKEDLWNLKGEYISGDIDSLGVRDTELVLDWLCEQGYCVKAQAIAPVQNASGVSSLAS